jgi:peroxiredoxin (alkyl hydroperoxide reductase subunit C)
VSQFRDAYDEFRRENVEVATLSVDSPYSHRVWAEELEISYPMLSDFDRWILDAYRIPSRSLDLMENLHTRSAFVIDADRILRYVWYGSESRGLPDVRAILGAARALAQPG